MSTVDGKKLLSLAAEDLAVYGAANWPGFELAKHHEIVHLLLIDDPIRNREEAYSEAARRALRDWYRSVAYTRLMPGAAIVLIQTRWHQDDLAAWLLREHASENWDVVSLPAIAERDEGWRKEGEALWPTRFPLEALARTREAIGSAAWVSMYQQRPTAEEGAVFNRQWWRQYQQSPECHRIIFSLDTAFKSSESADFSVIEVWGETSTGYCLLHVWRERAEFPELKRRAMSLAEIWKPQAVLIEDAASGQSLIQALKAESRLPVLPVKPLGDKVARASAVTPLIESGRVYLPAAAPWLADFMEEVSSFPAAPHDDMADALSQALNYLRGSNFSIEYWSQMLTRQREAEEALAKGRRPPKPPPNPVLEAYWRAREEAERLLKSD